MSYDQEITLSQYQSLAEFRYQLRRFLHFSEQAARSVGLEPQQHQLLLTLKGLPQGRPATVSEVAKRLQIQHHSTVELIDRMVDKNLLERSRDENDQRKVIIHLTPMVKKYCVNYHCFTVQNCAHLGLSLYVRLIR